MLYETDPKVKSEPTGNAQPGPGHNGGPPLEDRLSEPLTAKGKLQRIEAIIERVDLTAAQKCVGVGLVVKADRDGIAEAKTQELMTFASVKDRETVFRATRTLDEKEIVEKANKKGQSGRYNVMPTKVIEAIIAARDKMVADGLGNDDAGRFKPDGMDDVSGRAKPDGIDKTTGLVSPDQIDGGQAKAVGFQPTTVPQNAPACAPAPVDNTSHATNEFPSGIVTSEELASKLASSAREEPTKRDAEPDGWLAGSDDLIDQMVADALRWLGPPSTASNAREWLANTFRAYGDDVTVESYHKLKTDMARHNRIAQPIATWMRIAQRMKAERGVQAPACDSCWVDENGLHLANGCRSDWLKKFDGDEERLDMAIKQVALDVKLNSKTPIKVQVDGMLAKLVGEKLDRDARYARAATPAKPEKGISRLKQKFLTAGE